MKKVLSFILVLSAFFPIAVFSQASTGPKAKKPTLMVIPADPWMNTAGFVKQVDNQGKTDRIFDYESAFATNAEIGNVITKINGMMIDRGFPLKSMDQELKR
jgi:hypothetical protein